MATARAPASPPSLHSLSLCRTNNPTHTLPLGLDTSHQLLLLPPRPFCGGSSPRLTYTTQQKKHTGYTFTQEREGGQLARQQRAHIGAPKHGAEFWGHTLHTDTAGHTRPGTSHKTMARRERQAARHGTDTGSGGGLVWLMETLPPHPQQQAACFWR